MRYVVVLLVSILAVTWTPGLVSAQGLFGCSDIGSSGGLPILGKLFGKKKRAVSCYDDPPRGGGLAFYAGYLDNEKGVRFDIMPDGALGVGGTNAGIAFQYAVRGVLFGGSGTIPISERLDILVNGSWLLPFGGGETQHEWWDAGPVILDYIYSTKSQWWNVGGAATYNIAGPFSAMGGVMFDSFTTNFSSPWNYTGTFLSEDDEADLTVSSVIPYVGGVLTQGGPDGSLTIGMIGFPMLFGNTKYTQSWHRGAAQYGAEVSGNVDSGYFFEIFAEAVVNIRAMVMGIFAGWSTTHAKTNMDFDVDAVSRATAQALTSTGYTGSFYRSVWVVGGKFALDFTSPF